MAHAHNPPARPLGDTAAAAMLAHILDAGTDSPFALSDDMLDALLPVIHAYRAAYGEIARVVEAQRYDPTDVERREASAAASADAFRPWERAA